MLQETWKREKEQEMEETDDDHMTESEEEEEEENEIFERHETIHLLEQEITELQRRHAELRGLQERMMIPNYSTLQVYHVFHHGCLVTGPRLLYYIIQPNDLERFIFNTNMNNLEQMMEQWHRYITLIPSIQIHLHTQENIHQDYHYTPPQDRTQIMQIIIAHGSLSGCFSYAALATMIPNFYTTLLYKIINKLIIIPIHVIFHLNHQNVIRIEIEMDFLSSFYAQDGRTLMEITSSIK